MIKHKIPEKKEVSCYSETYSLSSKTVERVRKLLEIESFEFWDDVMLSKYGIVPNTSEVIISLQFEDGAELDWKLCCGDSNYYDDVIFYYPDGTWVDLDCTYELDDLEIDAGYRKYYVELDIKHE